MAVQALTNCAVWVAQADLTGYSNSVNLSAEVDQLDSTTFGAGTYRSFVGGLKQVSAEVNGFWDALDTTYPDERLWTDLGVNSVPVSFVPSGGANGDLAYFMSALRASYAPGGSVGELISFSTTAVGDGAKPLVRGTALHGSAARTSSGTGTAYQLGAVSASQRLYAAVHVFAVAGSGTFTPIIQSDNGAGMASPVTALSFTPLTAIGGQFTSVAGAITDDYFRVSYTITGFTSVTFAIVAGIAA